MAHRSYDEALAAVQTGLDVAGLAPGADELFDGINDLTSLARGDAAASQLRRQP